MTGEDELARRATFVSWVFSSLETWVSKYWVKGHCSYTLESRQVVSLTALGSTFARLPMRGSGERISMTGLEFASPFPVGSDVGAPMAPSPISETVRTMVVNFILISRSDSRRKEKSDSGQLKNE
jgi:hypothetical protein